MNRMPRVPKGKLIIPSIKVEAPLFVRKAKKGTTLPEPYTPDDVILYDFSKFKNLGGEPGKYGNSVLSGHVDSGIDFCNYGTTPPPCKAVLWDLDTLKSGDLLQIRYKEDLFVYKTFSNQIVARDGKHWDTIFESTKEETVTIFTCNGDYDRQAHDYNSRQVVKAKRIS